MVTRKRIKTNTPGGSGGGTSTVFGNVVWGPDFGENDGEATGADGVTFASKATMDLWSVDMNGVIDLAVNMDLAAISLAGVIDLGINMDLDNLALATTIDLASSHDLSDIALSSVIDSAASMDLESLALSTDIDEGVHLSGSVIGAPFWQSVTTGRVSNAQTAVPVAYPSGIVAGDLLLAFVGAVTTTSAVQPAIATPPTGWTAINNAVANFVGAFAFYRIADGSETGNVTFTLSAGNGNINGEIHRLIGTHSTTPINISAAATLAATSLDPDPDSPSVTTTVTNCMVFAFLAHDHLALAQTHTPAANHVERVDIENGGVTQKVSNHTQTRVFANAAATGTVAHDCTETVATNAAMLRVAIAPGPTVIAS